MHRRFFLATVISGLLASAAPAFADEVAFQVDARVALAAYQTLVEDHLTGVLDALKAIAESEEARSDEWDAVKPLLTQLADDLVTDAAVWYAHPGGSYDTVESGRSDQNLADREYFPGLMAGQDVIGPLVISKSTGHRSVIVATPVMVDGKAVAALGVSVRARLLSDLVTSRTGMPDDLVFYSLDPFGRTPLHRDPDKMFQYPSDIGDPSLAQAVADILDKDAGVVTYSLDGKERIGVFASSAVTGWKFILVQDAE